MARLFSTFREAAVRFSRDGCAFLAQALAFNALFALFPLVVLMLTGASYVLPHADRRVSGFFNTLAPTLHDYVSSTIQTYIYGRGISSIVALVILIWSGKNLFMALAFALDKALRVPEGRPIVHHIALAIVMLPIVGVLLLVALALPVMLSITMAVTNAPERRDVTHIGAYAVSIALVFAVATLLYTFLPNRRVSWRFAIPGATVAAAAWPLVQYAFAQYTIHINFTHIYGALSAPLVLLFWFYCIAWIFLYGAEFSVAWAWHSDVDIAERIPDVADRAELAPPVLGMR